tara:strand:- start:236 stop:559 length:324 start_codon:yes stop_codon:yes gene_type:complete
MFAVVRYAPTLNPWLRHFDYSFVKLWCTKQPRIGIPKIGRKKMKDFEQARYNSAMYRVTNKDWNTLLSMVTEESYYSFKHMVQCTLGKEVIRLEHGRVSNDWYFMVK